MEPYSTEEELFTKPTEDEELNVMITDEEDPPSSIEGDELSPHKLPKSGRPLKIKIFLLLDLQPLYNLS